MTRVGRMQTLSIRGERTISCHSASTLTRTAPHRSTHFYRSGKSNPEKCSFTILCPSM